MTDQGLPPVRAVVAAFEGALRGAGGAPTGLLGTLLDLHANNLAQWGLEDEARVPGASDAVMVAAKRGIDRLNLARHRFVELVDALIDEVVVGTAGAPPVTESPGMAFDRLSVLVIRLHHTELASRAPGPGATGYAARLPSLREQLAWLEAALERLLRDLLEGERSFLPYRHLKLYGPAEDPASTL